MSTVNEADIAALRASGTFDEKWYIEQYPDVKMLGMDPAEHYLWIGRRLGRERRLRYFDREWYRKTYLSQPPSDIDPVLHYRERGNAMGLSPHPWFRPMEYYYVHDDAARTGETALDHFLERVDACDIGAYVSKELRLTLRDAVSARRKRLGDALLEKPPEVSFVIPIYNGGRFLEDAVASALLSTDHRCELIVVDDGSTDPTTIDEIQRVAALYDCVALRKENGGLSSARNRGVEAVTAKAVKFLDCDDLLWPDSTDLQLREMWNGAAPAISLGEYQFCGLDGGNWSGPVESTIASFEFSEDSFFRNWEQGFSIPIHCALFPVEVVRAHKFREDVRAKEDWLFWMEVSGAGWRSHHVSDLVALYRIHGTNMCRNPEAMGLEYLKAAMFHETRNPERVNHVINHFAKAYLGTIKAAAIAFHAEKAAVDER